MRRPLRAITATKSSASTATIAISTKRPLLSALTFTTAAGDDDPLPGDGVVPEACTPAGVELGANAVPVPELTDVLAAALAPLPAGVLAPAVDEWPVVAGAV